MICEDVMKTDLECVSAHTAIEDAAGRMREENIGFLPVCDDQGRVLGTITDRDIAMRVVAARESPAQSVAKYMTPRAIACRPKDDLRLAEAIMSEEKVSRILCINERGELEGVISLSDIVQVGNSALAALTLRNVSAREVRHNGRLVNARWS